jgi:hypothetical protein
MRRLAASLILGLLPLACLADFQCNAQVRNVLVYSDGSVNVYHTGRNDYTYICNLKEERLGVDTATCAIWTSMVLSLKKTANTAQFYYAGSGSCATLPTYTASPAPKYIGDMS